MKWKGFALIAMIAVACLAVHDPACAGRVQTFGEGSAVTSIDRSATFDNLNFAGNSTPLSDYSSGGLSIFTNGNSFYGDTPSGLMNVNGAYFNPFHITNTPPPNYSYAGVGGGFYFPYDGHFGNTDWVTIKTNDGKKIYGVEFLYGNGWTTGDVFGTHTGYPWGNSDAYLDWETLVGGSVVSSGQVGISEYLPVGTVVGFYDPNGFDQLKVRAPHPTSFDPTLQELALDNLSVQISTPVSTPEPSALLLLGTGLLGLLGGFKMKKVLLNSRNSGYDPGF